MGSDEVATLRALSACRAVMDPLIASHRGRIVNTAGDSVLAEFASVVDAVRCAVEVQEAIEAANLGEPDERQMRFRIAVNLGDVLVKDGNLFGDGVNVAARLEALAEPGGICVSGTVRDHIGNKLPLAFTDLGEQVLKNIAQPVRAWRVGPATGASVPAGQRPTLARPDKPSLAVLAFQNLSGDPEQDYFADGMVEDITTALSRVKEFFVIARNSAFTYKGKSVDAKRIGRELGVRYLVEGSVRRVGDRVRITGQLIDTETGTHLWADRYDGALADVFELQDRVTASVTGAIEPSLRRAEIERAARKPPENLFAYDYLLRAIGALRRRTRVTTDQALQLARRAVELDQRYALALSYIAVWLSHQAINDWMVDEAAETAKGVRAAHLAVELDPDDPTGLANAAFGLAILNGDTKSAIPWLDRAIAHNPNSSTAFGRSAVVRNFAGDYVTAFDHAAHAMRLSPFDPLTYAFSFALGASLFFRRELHDAVRFLQKGAQENPDVPPTFIFLASALAHLGRLDEAHLAMAHLLEIRPKVTATWHRRRRLYKVTEDLEFMLEGARLAGLPE